MPGIEIRPAEIGDAQLILDMITELAVYEKLVHEVVATRADIERSLFGADATATAVICMMDAKPIGYAIYFFNYSTWLGKNGLYLEDLYVSPLYRKHGAGKALLKHLARIAVDNGCGRFEWSVLDWNQLAIDFYRSLGAKPLDGWVGYRLTGEALRALADS
jgi:GNAT superfamily N-acetyltransferase